MKTEMKMLDNGNYESVPCPIQHKCKISNILTCVKYAWDLGSMYLILEDGDPYEDGYSYKVEIGFCPICGEKA